MKKTHVSASQLKTFRSCPRKWYFEKICKLPRPVSDSAELGRAVHKVLEDYLRDKAPLGTGPLDKIASQNVEHLPTHAKIGVEVALHKDLPIKDAPLDVVGFIDVVDFLNHEVVDHKTTGAGGRYTLSAQELLSDPQMLLYGYAYLLNHPLLNRVRLTHLYYGTKKPFSHRSTVQASREQLRAGYDGLVLTMEQMIEAAKHKNAAAVAPNYNACSQFGGCPYGTPCREAHSYTPKEEPRASTRESSGISEPPPVTHNTHTNTEPKEEPRVVYIGCYPTRGVSTPVDVMDAYKPAIEEIQTLKNVPHLALVDYGRGWALLAAAIQSGGWPEGVASISLDPRSDAYKYVASALCQLADIVVRRCD